MKKLFIISLFFQQTHLFGQSSDSLIAEFEAVNKSISTISCDKGQLLSNRAMNLFMADRVGYYLSNHENLSYCKNNVTLNTASGIFSMTHSFFEPTGADLPLKSFNALGLKANIFDAFQATKNKTAFNNQLGITFKQFWISKPKVILNNCNEKQYSDAIRETILQNLKQEITNKSNQFEQNISKTSINEIQKSDLRKNFYTNLKEEYSRNFAENQFDDLFKSMRFKKHSMHWTNLNIYLPVIRQRFKVDENITGSSEIKKSYPAELSINHTRFLETHNATKLYLNLRAGLLVNNSFNNHQKTNNIILFKNFITPNISTQLVYFPPMNHFGLSAKLDQNFGKFNALNGTIGIPVVLIDKKSYALSNFEIQIHFFDLTNTLGHSKTLNDNISIGLTWGQAIGRNVY